MSPRIKVLGVFAILGFLLGEVAYVMYNWVIPGLIALFPVILELEWLYWGLLGSLTTVVVLVIWATISSVK
ncbi:hypothetical protein DRO47_01710 [Candidatus Bathyarchaeota archaeon]|nr:hypothetical protein [Candidatus Bathyarchaeota archaeon]RJS83448.1 MAG: hypothetical protein CW709_01215 [Candidatus Bathyarchaeota archaeon]RLG98831.1 MAG: hypothetical protein DRO28_02040 [Candidatus Bathyarchaeota archaeon]RLI23027.1 MAG: hypothetical protein DRO47_01710 [Candidatus Bathyarchaeota archaeon]HDN62782.1 hypothetical protein [Candidatus Bathyarchaeota archaeon]